MADGLFSGLRGLYGDQVVDYPKCEVMYNGFVNRTDRSLYGRGFTLYGGLLSDLEVDRFDLESKIRKGHFDIIIISNIWRQFGWFVQFRPWLNSQNCMILDGSDSPSPFPADGFFFRRPYYWFLPRAHREFLYFKREWTKSTRFTLLERFLPKSILNHIPQSKNLRRISFSIPEEKISTLIPCKSKDFPKHIVDPEVLALATGSSERYAFESEAEYYKDLQESRFGITTKRAGWDCLRHYEIAANGTVLCFRDLHKKPATCAPHGLVDGVNCINYRNVEDLNRRIQLTDQEYSSLRAGSLDWAFANSCKQRALEIIREFNSNCCF